MAKTSDYLARFLSQTGVDVIRVPVDEPKRITETLRQKRPALAIFETITNVPGVPVAREWDEWLTASPTTFFLIDNSVQSHLTRWFEILPEDPRLLVVESGTKYLTEECMVGVIKTAGRKLATHSRNVAAVMDELKPFASLFSFIRTLDTSTANEPALEVFRYGRGALIFAALKSHEADGESLAKLHRRLLVRWRELTLMSGIELHIRAGFGWNQTSGRAYESGRLNQPDAPCFIRISVGCEPLDAVRRIALALGQAARDVTEKQWVVP